MDSDYMDSNKEWQLEINFKDKKVDKRIELIKAYHRNERKKIEKKLSILSIKDLDIDHQIIDQYDQKIRKENKTKNKYFNLKNSSKSQKHFS